MKPNPPKHLIRIDDDIYLKLLKLAQAEDRSVTYIVAKLLKEHLS